MDLIDRIKLNFPIFHEKQLLTEFTEVGIYKEAKSGDVIIDYGSYMKYIPLLLEGSIRILRENEDGNEIFLYYLENGSTCAASFTCCMRQELSNIRAIAEEDVSMIMIPLAKMEEWMGKYTSWRNFVISTYSNRMEEMLKTIDLIAFKKMDERLLNYLEEKARVQESNTLHITHQQIATELNSSREVISRLLKSLEKMEEIRLGRNQIDLLG